MPSNKHESFRPGAGKTRIAAAAVVLTALAAVSTFIVRSCHSATSPEKQKTGETTEPPTVPVSVPSISVPYLHPTPSQKPIDGGTAKDETDGGVQISLEEACTNLWNSDKGNAGDQFLGLINVAKASGGTEEDAASYLERIATICRFQIDQLMRILKVAVEQKDSRVAGVINDYLERTCGTVTLDDSYGVKEERVDCGTLSADNPRTACEWRIKEAGIAACDGEPAEEQGACFGVYLKQVEEECSGLPEGESPRMACYRARREGGLARQAKARKIMEACPGQKADEWGMNIDDIRLLDAVARANELATSRLYFLNPDSEPTFEELTNYNMALRGVLFFSNNEAFLVKLGLRGEAEFKRRYIDEVAAAMRTKKQTLYTNMAKLLETLWATKEMLK